MSIVSPSLLLWPWCSLLSILTLVRLATTTLAESGQLLSCEPWQFRCLDGQHCLSPNRFCDGNEDCGDASDEPSNCTNCNRTLMGETGEKYPLRITEPAQRQTPFYCFMHLVAGEGHFVEVSFLSLQIGHFGAPSSSQRASQEMNVSSPVCRSGYMHLSESGTLGSEEDRFRSQQTRGFSQLISAVKEEDSRKRLSTLFDDATSSSRPDIEQHFGHFCGRLLPSSTGVSFYSTRSNVTLSVHLPPRTPVGTAQSFGLYFTYRFLQQQTLVSPGATSFHDSAPKQNVPQHFGKPVAKTYCNRTFSDCERKECLIRSPNYPGLFLKNFTCGYLVRQERAESWKLASIEVSQDNEYKIRVGKPSTGRQSDRGISGGSTTSSGLTSDCEYNDRVEIYDFKRNLSDSTRSLYLIAVFCGSGALSPIVSRGRELLVVLRSRSEGLLYGSRLELRVRVIFQSRSDIQTELRLDDSGKCNLTVNASVSRTGQISSPQHTLPHGTVCTVNFVASRPKERIWVYFLSYFVRYPIVEHDNGKDFDVSLVDKCDVSMLELNMGASRPNTSRESSVFRFCERTTPRMCTRAIGYSEGIPERACLPPVDSYLSTGTEATIRYTYFGSPEVGGSTSHFAAHFEFVNFEEIYYKRNDTLVFKDVPSTILCGKRFQNHPRNKGSNGSISSPANVFLYGRGGRESLECRYQFQVRSNEKLRVRIDKFWSKINNCETIYDSQSHLWTCRFTTPDVRRAFVTIRESSRFLPPLQVGCICSNKSIATISVVNMTRTGGYFYESASTFRGLPPERRDVTLEVIFTVNGMTGFEDHHHFGFFATFAYVTTNVSGKGNKECQAKVLQSTDSSANMLLAVNGESPSKCRWALSSNAPEGHPVLKLKGRRCDTPIPHFPNIAQDTSSRVLLYGREKASTWGIQNDVWVPRVVICLRNTSHSQRAKSLEWLEFIGEERITSIYHSSSFVGSSHFLPQYMNHSSTNITQNSHAFVLELLSPRSASEVTFEWRQTQTSAEKRGDEDRVTGLQQSSVENTPMSGFLDCTHRCPELNACINPELWCDGVVHCPSTAFDEQPENCAQYPFAVYAATATGISLLLGSLVALVTFLVIRRVTIMRERPQEPDIFACDLEPSRIRSPDILRKTSQKTRNPKYHTGQIRAVEVRHPVIHM